MADAEEEIVVKVEPEAEEPVVKVDPTVDKAKDPAVKDLADQFKALSAEKEAEAQRREDAERRAAASAREAAQLRQETADAHVQVRDSQLDTVTTALEAANAAIEAAQRDIQLSIENADAKAQAEAYTRLTKAATTAQRLEEAKDELESSSKARPQARAPADPVEAFIGQRTPRTAQWLRDHKDFITDDRKRHKLDAAHSSALSEGLQPDTDEYFDHAEKFLGLKDAEAKPAGQKVAPKRKETPPVAPASAAGGGGAPSGGNEVTLKPFEARAATDGTHVWNYDDPSPQKRFRKGDPIGLQEFARRKRELQKQGAYDRSYTEG